jgi:hypothetical protein
MIKRENQIIKIHKKSVAIALQWIHFEYSNVLLRDRIAQGKIKKESNKYGFLNFYSETKNGEIALTNKDLEGSLIGAYLLSQKINNAIYFAKVGINEENEEDFYWVCGIDEYGKIIEGTDVIVNDEQLHDKINEISTLYEEVRIYAPKGDIFVMGDNEDIKELELDAILTQETDKQYIVSLLEKKQDYKVVAGIALVVAITGYLGYEYVYKEKPIINDITNGSLTNQMSQYMNEVRRLEPRERSPSSFNQEERNQYAVQQLRTIMDESFYDKYDIINNLKAMYQILPSYLVEWELTPLLYNDNQFTFAYRRIENSSGYFNSLNLKVRDIMNENNFDYQLIGTSEQLTEAVYRINFESEKENALLREEARRASLENNRVDPAEQTLDEITRIQREIDDLIFEARNLGWIDRRWGVEAERLRDTINVKVNQVNDLLNRVERIYREEQEKINSERMESLNNNTYLDNYLTTYLNKSQIHQQDYIFTQPTEKGTLPSITTENNRNRGRDEYTPYIEIFEIGVRSTPFTTGLNNALDAMEIIDNRSILFYNVQYNTNNNEWVIRGNMYEEF